MKKISDGVLTLLDNRFYPAPLKARSQPGQTADAVDNIIGCGAHPLLINFFNLGLPLTLGKHLPGWCQILAIRAARTGLSLFINAERFTWTPAVAWTMMYLTLACSAIPIFNHTF